MRIALVARPLEGSSATPFSALRAQARALRQEGAEVSLDHASVARADVRTEVARLTDSLTRRWSSRMPDVVHAHGTVAALAATAAAGHRVPVALTFDEDPGQTGLEADLAHRADAVVVRAASERDGWLVRGVPRERVHTIPLPVDPVATVPVKDGHVVTSARGENLVRIIDSMRWWPEGRSLVVVSDLRTWEQKHALALAHDLGLSDRLVLNPLLRDATRSLWTRVSLVVAGPEGARHGDLVLAGAAHAVPAVAVDLGAYADAVVDGATGVLLAPNAEPTAVGQAVADLLRDKLRLEGFGLAAHLRLLATHDPATFAARTLDAYGAICTHHEEAHHEATESGAGDVLPMGRDDRTDLVVEHLPVARRIAQRYAGRGQALGDLVQVANLGLVKAARRFDPEQGADFLSYAVPTMLGELRRYFRDNAWAVHVPRGLQETVLRVQQADDALLQDLGHEVSAAEVAGDLGVSVDDVLEARQVSGVAFTARSLDAPVRDDAGEGLAELLGGDDIALENVEDRESLHAALARIPERERQILVLRFFGEHTQTEIAARLGISQMHVSRLLAKTLRTLRDHVVDGVPLPASWQVPASTG